jgi:hypothetical protein
VAYGRGKEVSAEYIFAWGNNTKRATLKGRRCRILKTGRMGSVMVEFHNGQKEIVSRRALRKVSSEMI